MPNILLFWIALAAAVTVFLSLTVAGRYLYAVGASRTVAEFAGVPVRHVAALAYVISGATSAFAGILLQVTAAKRISGWVILICSRRLPPSR